MRDEGIRVTMPELVFRLQDPNQLHMLQVTCSSQHFHPVRDGLAIRFLDGREVRRGTFHFDIRRHGASIKRVNPGRDSPLPWNLRTRVTEKAS